MRPAAANLVLAAAAAAVFAAPAAASAEVVRPGEAAGLGLFGPNVPEVLKAAKADPYAQPASSACDGVAREIAALDAVLGPDADAPAQRVRIRTRAERLVFQAARGFIPHRDIVRFVTGAGRRDKALSEAIMAGWARRGYLRGLGASHGCAAPEAAVGAATAQPVTAGPAPATFAEPVLLKAVAPIGPVAR